MTVTGTPPLAYQWLFEGTYLPGANVMPLILTNVMPFQAGTYWVVVTNSAGSSASSNALLSVYATAAAGLSSFTFLTNGFQLSITGVPGYNYDVQVSTDLVNWVSLQTNLAPFSFTDTNAGVSPYRFYRAVYPPR